MCLIILGSYSLKGGCPTQRVPYKDFNSKIYNKCDGRNDGFFFCQIFVIKMQEMNIISSMDLMGIKGQGNMRIYNSSHVVTYTLDFQYIVFLAADDYK